MFSIRSNQRLCFWIAGLMIVVAGVLLMGSKRIYERYGVVLGYEVEAGDYGTPFTVEESFDIPPNAKPLHFICHAPVDQSWVYVEAHLVNSDGTPVSESRAEISYYDGKEKGRKWFKLSRYDWEAFMPPETGGEVRLRLTCYAGEGKETAADAQSPGPPIKMMIIPEERLQSRRIIGAVMTWSTLAAVLAAVFFLMRGFHPGEVSAASHVAENSRRTHSRFAFIDGLRGVAVLGVLCCHFFVPEFSNLAPYLEKTLGDRVSGLVGFGKYGVEIFFVLSGFVIAYTLRESVVTPHYAGRFVLRRAVRLDPPYYVTLLRFIGLEAAFLPEGLFSCWHKFGGLEAGLSNAFYLQDILGYRSPLPIAWTLCLEIQFYITLMILGLAGNLIADRLKGGDPQFRARVILGLILSLTLVSIFFWYPSLLRFDFFGTWFRFGLGVLTCMAFLKTIPRSLWILMMVIVVGLSIFHHDPRGFTAAATAGMIYFVGETGRMGTWLSNRPIQFFGRISYSMYLIHLAAGVGVANLIWSRLEANPLGAALALVAGVGASILGSLILHQLFEKPGVAISQRLRSRNDK